MQLSVEEMIECMIVICITGGLFFGVLHIFGMM